MELVLINMYLYHSQRQCETDITAWPLMSRASGGQP